MELGFARPEDKGALQALWAQCFGDAPAETELYFSAYAYSRSVFTARQAGQIAAMAIWFPVTVIGADGAESPAAYLYAVATDAAFRRRGICRSLLNFAEQTLCRQGIVRTVLVPAGEELFAFYQKMGYETAFFCREFSVSGGASGARVQPVSAAQYYQLRQMLLWDRFVEWRETELAYQKALCRRTGGDLVTVETAGATGCAVVEKTGRTTLAVKELLLTEAAEETEAVRGILAQFQAERALVRTPCPAGAEDAKAFGMVKLLKPQRGGAEGGYLGIAFD